MTEIDQLKTDGNPIEATPGENIGLDATSTVEPSPEVPVTAPAIAPVIPQPIKETFLEKLEADAKGAWEWLEKEISKL